MQRVLLLRVQGSIQADANGWIIVDMKNDWKTIFPGGK